MGIRTHLAVVPFSLTTEQTEWPLVFEIEQSSGSDTPDYIRLRQCEDGRIVIYGALGQTRVGELGTIESLSVTVTKVVDYLGMPKWIAIMASKILSLPNILVYTPQG